MKVRILTVIFFITQLLNAQDTIKKEYSFHFSVVHSVSNHSSKSQNNPYHFSFNLLTGKIGSVNGCEIGGLYNQNTQNMTGLQISGLINNTKNNLKGVQIAGLSNFSGISSGMQISGLTNAANNLKGIQISGLMNFAKDLKGIQISGIYNQIRKLNGLQIGLINVVDTIGTGGTVGLINIVKNGCYREWEITVADYQNIGLSYKTGGKNIYSILNAGYNFSPKPLLVFGLGIGSLIDISNKWKFRPELVWNNYLDKTLKIDRNTTIASHLKFGLMRKLNDKMAITFMPSIFTSFKEKNGINYGYEISELKAFSSKVKSNSLQQIGFGLGIGFSFLK